ncbi:MAG: Ig-like domain-containing protein [Christensenellaceae bacterium]|nr:Ig-like domain-containing protein [Christensenellaceae bacterium]
MKKACRISALVLALMLACVALPALAETNQFHFDKTVNAVFEGESVQMLLVRTGDCAEEGTLTYTSSRESVATIDQSGVITGVTKGQTTITAELTTSKRTWKTTITVTVKRKVTAVDVKEDKLPLYQKTDSEVAGLLKDMSEDPDVDALPVLVLRVGSNQTVQATLEPKDANDRNFVLTTSDESIVKVQSNNFRPQQPGECVVTVQSRQNPEVYTAYRALVVQPVTKLTLSAAEKFTYVGGTLPLAVTYAPDNASIKAVTWTSANEKVATVDANGVVTGVSKGQVNIRATAADGSGKSATFQVTVRQQPESIELTSKTDAVNVGSYLTIQAKVLPNNVNDKSVTWSSSDESVAKVNTSGRVTPVGPGTCVITCASAAFPEVAASMNITVSQPVTKVSFMEKEVTVHVGGSVTVFWQVEPANATDQSVAFSSRDERIATVNADGTIYGVKRGSTTISVTAQDGSNKRATIKVNVLQPVEGVHMQNDTITVGVNESVRASAVLEPSDASNVNMSWTSEDETIATVRGTNNRPSVTGKRWGTTSIVGVTEDGGYVTTATVRVGNYDKALVITDLYLNGDAIKINVQNQSNMTITRFYYTIEMYDMGGQPLACNINGTNTFNGSYGYELYEGDTTTHGRFYFSDFVQPAGVGRVLMRITGYSTDDGYSRTIREEQQEIMEYLAPGFSVEESPNG